MFQRKSTAVFCAAVAGLYAILFLIFLFSVSITAALILGALITIPVAIVGWFILSLVLYNRVRRKENDEVPPLKARLTRATILLVFIVIMVAALFGLFAMAIMFM